jgi:endo-1,4-beta-D-glucanase Y
MDAARRTHALRRSAARGIDAARDGASRGLGAARAAASLGAVAARASGRIAGVLAARGLRAARALARGRDNFGAGWVVSAALVVSSSSCASSLQPGRRAALNASWRAYQHDYIQADGRVIDQSAGGITTSEGQTYALLRALWIGDERRFREVHRWTIDNLQGGDPTALPAWKWGATEAGSWAVIDPNPAADADLLLAWTLAGAAVRWEEPAWTGHAVALAGRVWEQETAVVAGRRLLLPGPWAASMNPVWVNPSYFMPFIFRDLARLDPSHGWLELVDSSYAVLDEVAAPGTGLIADWLFLDPASGAWVAPPAGEEARGDFGFEAVRLPWILAADEAWHSEPRATARLDALAGLGRAFGANGALPGLMGLDGAGRVTWESRTLYGTLLPVWAKRRPDLMRAALRRIESLRVARVHAPQQGRDYYASNWVWFGEALLGELGRPVELP